MTSITARFDEAMIERLASPSLPRWDWKSTIQAILAELSKTHAIVPLESIRQEHNRILTVCAVRCPIGDKPQPKCMLCSVQATLMWLGTLLDEEVIPNVPL